MGRERQREARRRPRGREKEGLNAEGAEESAQRSEKRRTAEG